MYRHQRVPRSQRVCSEVNTLAIPACVNVIPRWTSKNCPGSSVISERPEPERKLNDYPEKSLDGVRRRSLHSVDRRAKFQVM